MAHINVSALINSTISIPLILNKYSSIIILFTHTALFIILLSINLIKSMSFILKIEYIVSILFVDITLFIIKFVINLLTFG
jgi:hypothetical protein